MEKKNQYFPQSIPAPGEEVQEMLDSMQLDANGFAHLIGETEATILSILKGEGEITAKMAAKLEQQTRVPDGFWLRRQQRYDASLQKKGSVKKKRAANPTTNL